jgi:OOP family OmpA-OmpF porin
LVQESAWQIPENGLTTLEIMAPMRATLAQSGFDILFECEAFTCGGFDFRYALALLPEPEMHVDLADYRYLSAARGKEGVGLIVSRSASTAFVQVTFVGRALDVALSSDPVPPASAQATIPLRRPIEADPSDLATHLTQNGAAILTGLEFSAGSSVLSGANQQVIAALAEWMTQNPSLRIALVGHTDASGALEGNLTLSRQRAEAVRRVLVEQHGLDPQRIEAQGVGYLAPLASNLTEEGRRQNRRVEVMVTSTQASQ